MIAYVVNNVTRKEKGREASIAASVESATRRLVVEPFADAETAGSTKVALEVRKPDGQGVQGERRMMDPLATEKAYLKKHLNELASAHSGKFLLIKGD